MPFIGRTAYCVMLVIFKNLGGKEAPYSLISVDRIIELLWGYHKIPVERRWVFYILAFLEKIGFIKRHIRAGNKPDGKAWQNSSMIFITGRGARFLMSKLVVGATDLWKRIITWAKGKDKRWPNKKDIYPSRTNTNGFEISGRLKALVEMVGISV